MFMIFVSLLLFLLPLPVTQSPWMQPYSLNFGVLDGPQLLLEIDMDRMFKEKSEQLYDDVRDVLVKKNNDITKFEKLRNENNVISFSVYNEQDVPKVIGRLGDALGNDVDISVSGKDVAVSYSEKQKQEMINNAVSRTIDVVRKRMNEIGVTRSSIKSQGDKRVLVRLPKIDNPERIQELIGQTAKMTFHLVNEDVTMERLMNGAAPVGTKFLPELNRPWSKVAVYSRVELSGDSLKDFRADFDQNNMPVVTTVFNSDGARRFAKLTAENVGKRFAIVLDGKVLSAPRINEPITGGRGQISGGFTLQEAKDLAVLLRSGALPAPIRIVEYRTGNAD